MDEPIEYASDQLNANMLHNAVVSPESADEKDLQGHMYKRMANMAVRNLPKQTSSDDAYDSSEYSSDDNRDQKRSGSDKRVPYMTNLGYEGFHNAGFNTDSSDIEVLIDDKNNSSDSIEVLDSERPSDSQWGGNLDRQDTVVEQKGDKMKDSGTELLDVSEASDNISRTDTNTSQHDTLSDTATILSNSSASNLIMTDESKNNSPRNMKLSSTEPDTQSGCDSPDVAGNTKPTSSSDFQQFADCYASSHSSYGSPIHQGTCPPGTEPESPDDISNGMLSSNRPDSLVLPKPLQYYERQRLTKKESASSQSEMSSRSSSMDALLEQASNTPLSMQGVITRDGDMMSFVAEGLTDMIKRSSPMSRSRTESSVSSWSVGRSGAHTPSSVDSSTSGWDSSASSITGYSYSGLSRSKSSVGRKGHKRNVYDQPLVNFMPLPEVYLKQRSASELTQSPDDIPPIDPRALMEIESCAQKTASSLQHMMGTLTTNLHKMSSLTLGCLGAYQDGVDNTCDSVDTSIKSMYALMAKCEELSKTMRPIYELHEQIKEIKRLLDLFEAQMARYEKS